MGEWAGWVCGSVCVAFAVLKLVGTLYTFLQLRRKWRTVPELWALDWLDIVYRVERDFGVLLAAADFEGLSPAARWGLTAGQLWGVIEARLGAIGSPVPPDGWGRLVTILTQALNVKPEQVTPDSRLYADLDMTRGVE